MRVVVERSPASGWLSGAGPDHQAGSQTGLPPVSLVLICNNRVRNFSTKVNLTLLAQHFFQPCSPTPSVTERVGLGRDRSVEDVSVEDVSVEDVEDEEGGDREDGTGEDHTAVLGDDGSG